LSEICSWREQIYFLSGIFSRTYEAGVPHRCKGIGWCGENSRIRSDNSSIRLMGAGRTSSTRTLVTVRNGKPSRCICDDDAGASHGAQ